ncbi:MAG: DNA mismatch repair protein MutS [Bacteroidales bacterium]
MKRDETVAPTPLMRQYYSIKEKHPGAILLFRVGDFYETFGEDAITASKVLGIVLTKRANGAASHIELAGFPHHSLDNYLPKLVKGGYKVAVCDQLEDPKTAKKIVKRGVTELVTPGVALNDSILLKKENNFLSALHFQGSRAGVSFLDISTGSFSVSEGSLEYIELLISGFRPTEILIERSLKGAFIERFGDEQYITTMEEWAFNPYSNRKKLLEHFGTQSLKGFGIDNLELAITAAGATLSYLEQTHHNRVGHLYSINRVVEEEFVWIDGFTFRNLEIFRGITPESKTVIDILDNCSTPMGSRLLREWVARPSQKLEEIDSRLDIVEALSLNGELRHTLQNLLEECGDLERLVGRAAAGKISPREMWALRKGLEQMAPLKSLSLESGNRTIEQLGSNISLCDSLLERLSRELLPEPAGMIGKGDVIAKGVSRELDHLRTLVREGKRILNEIQQRESQLTEIPSLKIGYNNVFGYYLEVRNSHKDKVPASWIRKQTLVASERYITEELKEYEEQILGAEEKILTLERELFNGLIGAIAEEASTILENSKIVARFDCLNSFANNAINYNYSKPLVDNSTIIDIKEGRHPVIELALPSNEEYIPNDLFLDNDSEQIIVLTGPNMSGKSALLRQSALIVLMAQIGSFVPAKAATIGLVDKIFTRVGASDNISAGESTFMVEMIETASIMHNLSNRSLILLDEIGRGTSTYDGLAIAWAVVEYLHQHPHYSAKTLFATHYHQLNDLEKKFKRVKSWHISVKEVEKSIIFLRKLERGGVSHSFGIHVAQMAGIPKKIVTAAERVLKRLEEKSEYSKKRGHSMLNERVVELSLFPEAPPAPHEVVSILAELQLESLTPLEAFDLLRELQQKAKGDETTG